MSYSEVDYSYLNKLVLNEPANLIDASRNALFETQLTTLARTAGTRTLHGFVDLLRDDGTGHLRRSVAEAMTTNETSFFRDVRPFEAMRRIVIPSLMQQKASERTLRIWSAACSTGQEAYSMAMLLLEHFPVLADWDVQIVGTDLSRQAIEYAQRGRYRRMEMNRGLPARMLVKYFKRDEEEWEVVPRVRRLCKFSQLNLCATLPELPVFDLVLLRNVLLYLPENDRSCVLADVHRRMNPRGYLMLGNSEQAEDSTEEFEVEFASDSYYYRPKVKL
jgi:chemotaxis protein methyltransferase CheR